MNHRNLGNSPRAAVNVSAAGDERAKQAKSDNEPVTYADRGIELTIKPNATPDALRKLAEFAYRLYLSHTADSGGQ